jgi:glycine/D-amino acid oxidase-like deaminating enzyme
MPVPPKNNCLWKETCAEPKITGAVFPAEGRFDVVIIGAGYCGLSAALTLAESGKSVIVIERDEPGAGASGRNGGQVQAGFGTSIAALAKGASPAQVDLINNLANGSADILFSLVEKHEIACEPTRGGLLRGIHHPRLVPVMMAKAEADANLQFLTREETTEIVGANIYRGGIFDRRSGSINPMGLSRGLARKAKEAGATLIFDTAVTKFSHQTSGWSVETELGSVAAGEVILATNAYTDELHDDTCRSLVVVNSFQIATEAFEGGPLSGGQIVSDTRRLVYYYRRDAAGRFIIGGRGMLNGVDQFENYAFLWRWVQKNFPDIADHKVSHFWAGRVGITPDHIPHVHNPSPGLHMVYGFNGKGVAMAIALGQRLAFSIIERSPEALGLPLRPVRPIPFWRFRNLGVAAHVSLYRILDNWGY